MHGKDVLSFWFFAISGLIIEVGGSFSPGSTGLEMSFGKGYVNIIGSSKRLVCALIRVMHFYVFFLFVLVLVMHFLYYCRSLFV